ncbi:maleylacetoacetate isomerase [Marinobacterium maritimum]|uniref:Maleylacetoacetate isomerase n=1 Tax=Marinobacterium maritimum TaxID=500162 RepID=A0ABP3T5Y4_9GAMM
MDLYTYYRSTSSYRVRIALALKQLDCRHLPINLIGDGGEHHKPAYLSLNPQGRVPALRTEQGELLTQSPAIIEYLEECYPTPALLPKGAAERAKRRAVAAIIGCDIQPLHNMAVLNQLRALNISEEQIAQWLAKWIGEGLHAVEQLIGEQGFCFGEPGLADVYLLPQLYAARRFNVDLSALPRILRVEKLALAHPAFIAAHPDSQLDKPQTS